TPYGTTLMTSALYTWIIYLFTVTTLLSILSMFKRSYSTLMSRDGGSGYRTYVFKESIRRCAIDRKGRGRKEVIYPRVDDISCTRGVRESTGLSYGGPCGGVP